MDTRPDSASAADLRLRIQEPIFNSVIKKWVGRGELDYEVYLKTPALLSLQFSPAERSVPEELMFQVVHQAQELWLKLLAHEITEIVGALDRDTPWHASAGLERGGRILACLAQELRVLETLTPDVYQIIRRNLGNGSGQESPGYNAVRLAASGLEAALERLLERQGASLSEVYLGTGFESLKRLCEEILDLDEGFQVWLMTHFMLVRRTIGIGRAVKALDGYATQMLQNRMLQPLFPELWEVRAEMTAAWHREGGYAPEAPRSPLHETGA